MSKCSIPTVCLQGSKLYNDYCDYNFECLSKCCSRDKHKCDFFSTCYDRCEKNSKCQSGCCSQGFCTYETICTQSAKKLGDTCDKDVECQPGSYCNDGTCKIRALNLQLWHWILVIFGCFAIVGFSVFLFTICTASSIPSNGENSGIEKTDLR